MGRGGEGESGEIGGDGIGGNAGGTDGGGGLVRDRFGPSARHEGTVQSGGRRGKSIPNVEQLPLAATERLAPRA